MELRVLQYFLAVTREQSISRAAESLHLSQPTLSRQLRDMEEELGKQLFIRSNRNITLTEEGMILRKRAEEIMELVAKATDEITLSDETIAGDITIGAGESEAMRFLVKAVFALQQEYPRVHLHVISGDKVIVMEHLDRGLIDFGLLIGQIDSAKYESVQIPFIERYGVLMRQDSPLASKEAVSPEDLWDKPLILPRQAAHNSIIYNILGKQKEELNVVASCNLLFNGSLMVDEGMGYAVTLDKIVNTTGDSNLCFRPLNTAPDLTWHLVWKKYQVFTKASQKFLEKIQAMM